MSERGRNRVRCPRCKCEFESQWGVDDFETCAHPACKFEFLIRERDVVRKEAPDEAD